MLEHSVILEKKYLNNGRVISLSVHLLLLLLAFFYYLKFDLVELEKEEKQYEVEVGVEIKQMPVPHKFKERTELPDFRESSNSTKANADEGAPRPESEAIEPEGKPNPVVEANNTPPPPTPSTTKTNTPTTSPVKTSVPDAKPSPPVVVKSKVEDSPVRVEESDIEIERPKKDAPTTKPTGPVGGSNTKPNPNSTTNGTGSPQGKSDTAPSKTNGTGQGKSTSGDGKGSDSGPDNTSGSGNSSDGTGEYDGSGDGIFGRKVIYRNWSGIPMTSGKVSIKTCINRAGLVSYVEIINEETTIRDKAILRKALSGAKGYKFQPDAKAPKEECGKLTFVVDNNTLKAKH